MIRLLLATLAVFASVATAQDNEMDVTTAELPKTIHNIEFEAEEPGSGDAEPLPECAMTYVKYEKTYLQGVKKPNLMSFNTTFEECEKLCCYETRFQCLSFSYFSFAAQCFIMNVTQHTKKFYLAPATGHVHVERVVIVTTTPTTTTTRRLFPTPAYTPRRPGSSSERSISAGVETRRQSNPSRGPLRENKNKPADVNDVDCPKNCANGGRCRMRKIYDSTIAQAEAFCECRKGYGGHRCEKKILESGFPAWMIAVIVLGSIIVLLLLAVAMIYFVYWKKTGEYHVLKAIRKWATRGKKPRSAESTDGFIEPDEGHPYTSPTTSVGSIHGSLTSSATHSTSTSV